MPKGKLYIIQSQTIKSDAHIKEIQSSIIKSDAYIYLKPHKTKLSDAHIRHTYQKTITSDAQIQTITDITGLYADVNGTNTIIYGDISRSPGNTHIEIVLNGVTLKSWLDAGFEYYDGAAWQTYPTAGVASMYYGNQWRYKGSLTTTGQVRARAIYKG